MSVEQYNSMVGVRRLLESLSVSDGNYQTLAQTLLKNYPDEFRIQAMIGHMEEYAAGHWVRHKQGNPVEYHPEKGGWIFWDETWSDWHGPFSNMTACGIALRKYCEDHLDSPPQPS